MDESDETKPGIAQTGRSRFVDVLGKRYNRGNLWEGRRAARERLRTSFTAMVTSDEYPQERGYALQTLLQELFRLYDLVYRPPLRTTTDEVDGSFEYRNVPYLVEARWRKTWPTQTDLSGFLTKVQQRLHGTRGLFISIPGFRQEVVEVFSRRGHNILLMDGSDLPLILQEQVSLTEALDLKIQRASTYGDVYFRLAARQ